MGRADREEGPAIEAATPETRRIPEPRCGEMIGLRRKIAYGMGDMGLSVSYFAVSFFFLYYLTDLVGLEPWLAGLAWFIGQAWDSVNDPLMGVISDRTVSRFGRKRVYLLFGAVPYAASFALLWVIPMDGSQMLKFAFATLAMLAYTTLYSMVLVPYVALVPVMTNDYDERTRIVGIRAILSTVGTLAGGASAMLVSSFSSELTGLRVMALAFGLVVAITVLSAAQSVRGMETVRTAREAPRSTAWRSVRALVRDRNVATLLSFKFLGALATGSLMASLPYFAKNILADEGRSTIGLALYITVAAACIPIWERLSRRFDKRRLLLAAMLALAVIIAGIGLLVSDQTVTAFYAGCALMGTVMSAYVLIAFSFPPDLVDHFERETDERPESLIFGLWLTVHQMGVAVAGLLLGLVLQLADYDGAAAQQSAPALLAVRLSLGVLPGVAMVLAVLVLQRYGITRQAYAEIRQVLESRADARDAGAPA
jgi:glycoside/pentoside/hexuronide:cation symporter, GPH family